MTNDIDILKIDNETGRKIMVEIGNTGIALVDKERPPERQSQSAFALKNCKFTKDPTLTLQSTQPFILINFLKRTRWTDLQPLGQARGDGPPLELPFEATTGTNAGGKILSAKTSPGVHMMVLSVKGKRGAYQFAVESRSGVRPLSDEGAPLLRHDPDVDIEC